MATKELTEDEINMLVSSTGIRRDKILEWYESYRKECFNNCLNKKMFVKFYGLLLPKFGNSEQYSNLVFKAFDKDGSGYIDFSEFLLALSLSSKGTLEDRLNWTFNYYDQDQSDFIDARELKNALDAVYKLMGVNFSATDENSPENKANKILTKLDIDNDRKVSRAEFIQGCMEDPYLRDLLGPNM